ncbi:hypothetical protein IV203_010862 [Nitzschia inconspicua]|uniref:Uncharacterized protein n=1 Tax=Nitzschia inconspicua TaxID=303405 RepID=A0A9K3KXX7_9STRA|nr:hypothetical protein IV203_010862 [Nitzschia inconspicua]
MASHSPSNTLNNNDPSSTTNEGPQEVAVVSRSPLFKDPSYDWSLDVRNNHTLETKFLAVVKDKILDACSKYRLILPERSLRWLEDHGGHYEMYTHPDAFERKTSAAKYRRMSTEERYRHVLSKDHLHVAVSPRFGNYYRSLAPLTLTNYEKLCRMFWNFLAIIGDYDSMLMLLITDDAWPFVPSVNHKSIVAFVKHRFLPAKTPLYVEGTAGSSSDCPLVDIYQKQVSSEGTVNNRNWLKSFFAALNLLHRHNDQTGTYREVCQPCYLNFSNDSRDPCLQHPHHQAFSCSGNPTTSTSIDNVKRWLDKESQDRLYRVTKRQAIFPSDISDIQQMLHCNRYDLQYLKFYVMILNSLDCAMRVDGFSTVEFSHFEDHSAMWMVHNKVGIEYLVQSVKGKTDKGLQLYKIGFKHRHPKMCFLRHLLVYVHCTSHRSGYLYRETVHPYSEAATPQQSENAHVSHKQCLGWIQAQLKRCQNSLQSDNKKLKFGTHSLLLSFYLFGTLGGCTNFEELMRNARHSHDTTARGYYQDSVVIAEEVKRNDVLATSQDVWPFESRLLTESGVNLERLQRFDPSHLRMFTLQQAAEFFVQSMLGVLPSNPNYRTPSYLLQLAYKDYHPTVRPEEQFQNVLLQLVPQENHSQVMSAFQLYLNAACVDSQLPSTHPTNQVVPVSNTAGVDPTEPTANTGSVVPTNDITSDWPRAAATLPSTASGVSPVSRNELPTRWLANTGFINPTDGHTHNAPPSNNPLLQLPPLTGDAARALNSLTIKMVCRCDAKCSRAKRVKNYRLRPGLVSAIARTKGETVIRALFRWVVEIAAIGILEAPKRKPPSRDQMGLYNVEQCYSLGRRRFRTDRRLFDCYMKAFCRCLSRCHGFQLESFLGAVDSVNFSVRDTNGFFKGCSQCTP